MASTEGKLCLYEVLGLSRDCTVDEIRSAYKRLALQRHPDKLVQSGIPEAEATAAFQELVNAYEVLSDPKERAWYDSHRSQILFSGASNSSGPAAGSIPNLFSFFSNSVFSGYSDIGKGFFKVYGDVFDKIYSNELSFARKLGLDIGAVRKAPVMGNLQSPYEQVTAFYGYWLGFATVMDFCWVDHYDAMAGPNRKSRRVMEEENKKLRKKARREYNETVRGLAEFVKKRDKRVIDMQVKRKEEMERKREQERQKKNELERQKMERARAYKVPQWAEVMEDEEIEEVEDENRKNGNAEELYCVACGKKFKSEKQWKNHEQSKKHKEKVAELREAFSGEEIETEDGEGEVEEEEVKESTEEELGGDVNGIGSVSAGEKVDALQEQFGKHFQLEEEESGDSIEAQSGEEERFVDADNGGDSKAVHESVGSDDDEASILKAMLSGHKNKKNVHKSKVRAFADAQRENASEKMDFMENDNRKSNRRNRRRDKSSKIFKEEDTHADEVDISGQNGKNKQPGVGLPADEVSSHIDEEKENNDTAEDRLPKHQKPPKQPVDKKGLAKKDLNAKAKNPSQGRKQKATTKPAGNVCETCGEEFGSKNNLHKHLGDTGHATLKSG